MNAIKLLICANLLFLTACVTTQGSFTSTGGDGFNVLMSEYIDTIKDKNFTRKDKIKRERILSNGTILMDYQFGKNCIIYVNLNKNREVLGKMGKNCGFAFNNDIDMDLRNLIKSYATYNEDKTLKTVPAYKNLEKELQDIKLKTVKVAPVMVEMKLQKAYLDEYVFGMSKEEYKKEKDKLETLEKELVLKTVPIMQSEAGILKKMINLTNVYHKAVIAEHEQALAKMNKSGIDGFIEIRDYLEPVDVFTENLKSKIQKVQ